MPETESIEQKGAVEFYSFLGSVLKAFAAYSLGGKKFSRDAIAVLFQVASSVKLASDSLGNTFDLDNKDDKKMFEAIVVFKADAIPGPGDIVIKPLLAAASKLYTNITLIITWYHKFILEGKTLSEDAKTVLSQLSQCLKKLFDITGATITKEDVEDKELGDAMAYFLPSKKQG